MKTPWFLPAFLLAWVFGAGGCTGQQSEEPHVYTRPEMGDPVTSIQLADVTDRYLELIEGSRYFDFVEERAHGWPESDPNHRYWYGTWWSGVSVVKEQGRVSYRHSADGAENNALRTAPLLEGACFAWLLSEKPEHEHLVHKLMRGFSSWILAMEREGDQSSGTLMARSAYPEPVLSTDHGREVWLDYSLNRPGSDGGASQFVYIPNNPKWGEIWIQNKRSKDDIGHLMRSIAQLFGCAGRSKDPAFISDFEELVGLHRAWCQRVEDDGWSIATYDKEGRVWIPPDDLAHFVQLMNAECDIILAVRMFGRGDPGEWDCGNGISDVDEIFNLSPSNAQMIRSYHEAAVSQAFLTNWPDIATSLLEGLAVRIETTLDKLESDQPPAYPSQEDMAEFVAQSANVGLPLTWREVRYVHQRILEAHASYLNPGNQPVYNPWDPQIPDGTYGFEPGGSGFSFRNIGAVLGSCASPYRNPTSKPILDCQRVQAAMR